eukprot:jgi/Mesvir1/17713/Mv03112-RA.1
MESREINNRVFRCDNGEMKLMSKFGISLSAPSVDISAQTLRVNNAPLSSLQISDGAITTEKLDPDLLARLPAASDLYKPFTGSFTASPYVWRFPAEDNSRIAFVNPATAAATLQGNTKRVVVRGGLDVDSITFNNAGGAFQGVTGFDTDAVTASPNDGPVLKYLANTAGASQGYMFGATQPVANVGGNQQRVVITGGLNVDRVGFRGHEVSGFFTGSYNELRDKPDSLISGLRTELNALQAEVQAIGGVTLDEITSITVLDQGGDPLTSTHRVKEVTVVFGSDVATGSFTANDVNASFVYSSTLPLSDAVSGLTNVSGDSRTFRFVLTIPDVIAKGTQGQVPQTPVLGASAPDTVAVTFDYVSQSVLDDTYGTNGVITNKVSASARFNAPDFFSQPSTYVNGGGALTASLANDSNGERKILRIVLTAPVPDGAYQAEFEVYITSSAVRNALALGCESKHQRWDMDLRTEDTLNLQQYTVTLTSADVAQFSLTFDKDIAALGQEFTATLQSALSARVDASSHQWQAYDASKWEVVANPAPELTAAKTLQFRVDFRKIKTAPLDSGIKGVLLSLAPGALFATVNNSQGQPMTTHPITKMVGTPLTFTAPTNRPLLSDALVAFNNADWQNNGYLYVVFNYTRAMQAGSGHAYADVVVDTLSGSVTGSELVGSITTTDPTPTTYANSPTQRVMRYNLTAAIAALGSANAARLTLRVTPRHDLTPADTYGITMQAWTGAPISRSTDLPTESTAYVVEGVTVTRDLYRSGGQSSVTTPNVSSFDLRIQFSTRFAVLAADLADVSSLLGFRNVSGSSTANKGIVVEYSQTPLLPLLVQYKAKDPNNMYLDIVVTPWVRNTRDGGKVENFPPPSVDAKFKVTIAGNRFRPSQATSRYFAGTSFEVSPYTAENDATLMPFGFLVPDDKNVVASTGSIETPTNVFQVDIPYVRGISDTPTWIAQNVIPVLSFWTQTDNAGKPVNEQIIGTNHGVVAVTKATTTKIRIRFTVTTTLLPNQGSIKFAVPDFAFSDTFNVGNGLFEVGRVSTPYSYVTSYNRTPTQSVLVTLDPGYPNVSNPYELRFTVTFAIAPEGFTANPQSSTETVIDSGSAGWSALVKEHVPKTPPSGEYESYTRTANVRFVSSAGDKSFTYSAKLSASNWSGQTGSQIQVAFQWSSFQVSSERAEFPSAVSDVIATTSGFAVRAIAIDEVEGEDDQIEVTFSLRGSLTHYNNAPRTDGPHDVNFVTKATILNDFETSRPPLTGWSLSYIANSTYLYASEMVARYRVVPFFALPSGGLENPTKLAIKFETKTNYFSHQFGDVGLSLSLFIDAAIDTQQITLPNLLNFITPTLSHYSGSQIKVTLKFSSAPKSDDDTLLKTDPKLFFKLVYPQHTYVSNEVVRTSDQAVPSFLGYGTIDGQEDTATFEYTVPTPSQKISPSFDIAAEINITPTEASNRVVRTQNDALLLWPPTKRGLTGQLLVDGVSFLYTPTPTPRVYIRSTSNTKEFLVTFDFSSCHRLPTLDVTESNFTILGSITSDAVLPVTYAPTTHELVSFTRGEPGSMVWSAVARITKFSKEATSLKVSISRDTFEDSAGVKNFATESSMWQNPLVVSLPPLWRWRFWVEASTLSGVLSNPVMLDIQYMPQDGDRDYPSAASIMDSLNSLTENGVRKVTMSFKTNNIEATGLAVGTFSLGLTPNNTDMFRLPVDVAWFAGAPGTITLTLPKDLAPVDAEGFSNEECVLTWTIIDFGPSFAPTPFVLAMNQPSLGWPSVFTYTITPTPDPPVSTVRPTLYVVTDTGVSPVKTPINYTILSFDPVTELYTLRTYDVLSSDKKWQLEYGPRALQGPIGAAGVSQYNDQPVIGSVALPGANSLSTRARITSAYIVP